MLMNTTGELRLLLGVAIQSDVGVLVSLKLAGVMTLQKIDVRNVAAGQTVTVVVRKLPHNLGRGAKYETARRDDRAFGHNSAGANNTPSADY